MRKVVTKTLREFKNGMLLAGVCVHVCADAGWCKKRDGKGSKIYQMFMYRRVEKNKIGKRFLKFNNDFCWLGNWGWQGWRICRGRIKSVTTWYGPLRKILWLRINAKCRWQIKREWESGVDSRRVDHRLLGTSLVLVFYQFVRIKKQYAMSN